MGTIVYILFRLVNLRCPGKAPRCSSLFQDLPVPVGPAYYRLIVAPGRIQARHQPREKGGSTHMQKYCQGGSDFFLLNILTCKNETVNDSVAHPGHCWLFDLIGVDPI